LRVHFLRLILLIGFTTSALVLFAQEEEGTRRRGSRIIDDTTKQIYGPTTSRYYHEQEVFFNRLTYYPIDTVIRNCHRYNYVHRYENCYQDLGNIGTAIRPIYYQVPEVIGATSGFQAYDLYWDSEPIKYYDTKSPHSNMKVILGGKGRSITRATYSRNINPRWNFGFTYRGLFIDKQIQRQGKGDRNVRSNYYDVFTSFQSKDSTYRLFFNFRRNKQEADEYGGVAGSRELNYEENFFVNAQPTLTEAASVDTRTNIHLFHQYELGKALQFYHVMDRYRQQNDFTDRPSAEPDDYYDFVVLDSDTTEDRATFKTFRNEVGIKGNLLKLFYNGYYALRSYNMDYKYIDEDTIQANAASTESYLGGRMSLKLDSLVEVTAWAEVMSKGNYRIEGFIKSKWFDASIKQLQYMPTFLQQAYLGSHDVWNNNFSDINVTTLNGAIHYNSSFLKISPGVTFTRIGNYVFFKENTEAEGQKVLPVQAAGEQVILSPELRLSLTVLRHIHLRSHAVYTRLLQTSEDAIQVPELFVNAQLAYENIFFGGNLDMHAGVDLHWNSAYFAPGYDVPIQQFYIQKQFEPPSFPLVDIFFNAKIKRGRIFVKLNNLVQMITKEGYMLTPYYPGQRNVIDFGFDWSFYD
jgi:hypothetical protein